jgi:hypothetical protein
VAIRIGPPGYDNGRLGPGGGQSSGLVPLELQAYAAADLAPTAALETVRPLRRNHWALDTPADSLRM